MTDSEAINIVLKEINKAFGPGNNIKMTKTEILILAASIVVKLPVRQKTERKL